MALKNSQDADSERGDNVDIETETKEYILHRFKSMSYFSNCVPYEYSPHLIRSDLEKADLQAVPDEDDIQRVIDEAKYYAREKILAMLKASMPLSRLREWCEYSPQCPVPIPSLGNVSMNRLLDRFDYFNYELNRLVRESQISMAIQERKQNGIMFDAMKLAKKFERDGLRDISDEFSKLDTMDIEEINETIKEAEDNAEKMILNYILQGHSRDEIIRMTEVDDDIPFSNEEIPQVVDALVRKERFSTITREIARMETSEMWNLINNIESFRMWRLSIKNGKESNSTKQNDNKMLEMLKLYEQSKDNLKEGYLFQVSKLGNTDLSQLVRLIQGLIAWKGAFYYMPKGVVIRDGNDLSNQILEGFSHEHGMDPDIFRMFLLRTE